MCGTHPMRGMMTGTSHNKLMIWLAKNVRARYIHHFEVLFDNVVGYAINFLGIMLIFNWWLGHNITLNDNLLGGIGFFIIAYARKYTIRRWFSNFINKLYDIKAELEKNEKQAGAH